MDIPKSITDKFPPPKEMMFSRIDKEGIHCFCVSKSANGGVAFCITRADKSMEFEFNRSYSLRSIAQWLNEQADMMSGEQILNEKSGYYGHSTPYSMVYKKEEESK